MRCIKKKTNKNFVGNLLVNNVQNGSMTMILKLLVFAMIRRCVVLSMRSLERYGVSLYNGDLASRLRCDIKQGTVISDETGKSSLSSYVNR